MGYQAYVAAVKKALQDCIFELDSVKWLCQYFPVYTELGTVSARERCSLFLAYFRRNLVKIKPTHHFA